MIDNRPEVALVLGAGSARGLAHIGVLQVLAENNIPLDLVVGSSMGAMVAGIYACGADLKMLDRMIEYMNTNILYDIRVPRMGFIAGKKITTFLELLTKNKNFEELDFPLAVVATDLISGEKIVIEEGSVAEAVRASISIPGVFHPVRKDGQVLVDGAVTDRLPVQVAIDRGYEMIIAVDVTYCPGKIPVINNSIDVILTSLDIMQKPHFDYVSKLASILIQPAVGGYSSQDFDCSRELVDLGREAALEKLPEILKAINRSERRVWK